MIPPPQAYQYPPPVPSMYMKEHQGPPLMQLIPNGKIPKKKSPFQKEQDQEIAGFLLSLKHSRSVSPEPSVASSETTASNYSTGASAFYATGGYAAAPPPHGAPPPGAPPHAYQAHYHHSYPPPPHHYQYYPPPPHMHPGFAMSYHPHPSSQQSMAPAPNGGPYQDMAAAQTIPSPPAEPVDLEKLIEDSPVVTMKERDLVPDVLFACMAQMDVAQLGQADRVGCYKDRPIGFKGLCCRHCGGQPGFGRFFPNSVRSLAQTTTSQTIVKHVISKCRFTPADVRSSIIELQRQQITRETNGRPRYGSRKIFFQRIWGKLHDGAIGVIDEYYDGSAQSNKDAIAAQLDEPALIAAAAVSGTKVEDVPEVSTSSQEIVPEVNDKKRKGNPDEDDAGDHEEPKRFKPLEEAEV